MRYVNYIIGCADDMDICQCGSMWCLKFLLFLFLIFLRMQNLVIIVLYRISFEFAVFVCFVVIIFLF